MAAADLRVEQQDAATPSSGEYHSDLAFGTEEQCTLYLEGGGSVHDQIVDHFYYPLKRNLDDARAVTEDAFRPSDPYDTDDGYDMAAVREEVNRLFGYGDEDARFTVVKELPYFHFAEYPDAVDAEKIQGYVAKRRADGIADEPPQMLGDLDVAVFDRATQTVYHQEVKGNNKDTDADGASGDIDDFAVYADAFGWDVEGEVVLFNEEDRDLETMTMDGTIERWLYLPHGV